MENFAAIILSAGSGSRMKSDIPKQYMDLNGKPVIYYSLKAFEESGFSSIILVCGKNDVEYCKKEIVEKFGFTKVKAVVPGGKERYHSVYEGLKAIKNADYVFIHDGARPMITPEMIKKLQEVVRVEETAIAGMPVKDTIKIVDENDYIENTPDRNCVWQVQTPQCFTYSMIYEAYHDLILDEEEGVPIPSITDDAMVVSYATNYEVKMVKADYKNIKITTPEDIAIASIFLN